MTAFKEGWKGAWRG